VTDQVSHPYKTTTIVFDILTSKFLERRGTDERLWTER
jgi:hypothetical protein